MQTVYLFEQIEIFVTCNSQDRQILGPPARLLEADKLSE
jgi:hypothetical protein